MEALVYDQITSLNLGEAHHFASITVTPLFGEAKGGPTYMTLSKGLASGLLKIEEISEDGSVPDLRLVSELEEAVLLIDGEELVGAKQNRVLNASLLAAAHSKIVIPVSCTEAGRWSYASDRFGDSGVVMTARDRAAKSADVHRSLERDHSYRSDQGAVWSRISEMQSRLGVQSETGAMRDAYSSRREQLEDFEAAFPCQAGQTGLAVSVDGHLLGLEFVSRAEAYADLHGKLVKSYAMEMLLAAGGVSPVKNGKADVSTFIEQLHRARETRHSSVGLGRDYRYAGVGVVGSALIVDGNAVHAAFFRPDIEQSGTGRMASFSRRSGFRSQDGGDQ